LLMTSSDLARVLDFRRGGTHAAITTPAHPG
jgi:hypothetical protein